MSSWGRLHWLRDVGNLKRCNFSSFAVGLRFWSPQVPSKDNSWMTKIDFWPACPGPSAGCTIEIMATPCCSTLRSGLLLCYHLECPQARIKTMKIEESGLEPMFLCPSWCMLNTSALQSWARRNRLGRATATTFWSTFRSWGTLFTSWTRQLTILRIGSTGCCRRPHCWMYLRDSARLVWSLRNVYFSFSFFGPMIFVWATVPGRANHAKSKVCFRQKSWPGFVWQGSICCANIWSVRKQTKVAGPPSCLLPYLSLLLVMPTANFLKGFHLFGPCLRLERPSGKAKVIANYARKAKSKLVLEAAAKSWINGVPWDDALRIARNMAARVEAQRKGKGQGKGRGKGRSWELPGIVHGVKPWQIFNACVPNGSGNGQAILWTNPCQPLRIIFVFACFLFVSQLGS